MCAHCVQMRDDCKAELAKRSITEEHRAFLRLQIQKYRETIRKNELDIDAWTRRLREVGVYLED